MSWILLKIWIIILVDIKINAFEKAWKIIWKILIEKLQKFIMKIINLSWLVVLKAIIFFKSNQPKAKNLDIIHVKILKNLKKLKI